MRGAPEDGGAGPPEVDTIVAPCTAPGEGERAIVKLSGPAAHALLETVVDVETAPLPGRVGRGGIDLGGGARVPVLLLGWRAPRSSTGEDVAEVHLPGWPPVVTELVRRFVAAGARPAARGEFTRRAVATGRLTLDQGLAVGRLVEARDADEARAAAAVLTGTLARLHSELREALLAALALIEAHVDFEEDDTEAIGEPAVRAALEACRGAARRLGASAELAPSSDGETDVVLLGPPNAGKSALFRALCPGAKTTVSPVPGTTRDALEARVVREGRRFRLIDGPGVRRDRHDVDPLDARAMDLFAANLPTAAVVLDVEDVTAPSTDEEREHRRLLADDRPRIVVLNKCDLLPEDPPGEADVADTRSASESDTRRAPGAADSGRAPDDRPPQRVSALRATGLDALWEAVARAAPAPRAPDLSTRAQREAAAEIEPILSQALDLDLAAGLPMVSLALREALDRIADPESGEDVDEEILDRVFASFCIGK